MPDINNPHDIFLKAMLSDIAAAREFLKHFLPADVVDILDLTTLKTVKESFLTGKMKELFSDLIFECRVKAMYGDIMLFVSILIEHKSTPQKHVSIQMGRYLFEAYQQQIDNNTDPLRPIIPVLYYHGDIYWQPKSLKDLFKKSPENLKIFLPDFHFVFQNLNLMQDDELRRFNHLLLASGLLMQKYYKNLDALFRMGNDIFRALAETEGNQNLKYNYVVYLSVLFTKDEQKFKEMINQLPPDIKEETKHFIQKVEERGMEKGREEGMEKAKTETVVNMLRNGMDIDLICNVVNVSKEFVFNVQKKTSSK